MPLEYHVETRMHTHFCHQQSFFSSSIQLNFPQLSLPDLTPCGVASVSAQLHDVVFFTVKCSATYNGFVQVITARPWDYVERGEKKKMEREDVIHKLRDGWIPL